MHAVIEVPIEKPADLDRAGVTVGRAPVHMKLTADEPVALFRVETFAEAKAAAAVLCEAGLHLMAAYANCPTCGARVYQGTNKATGRDLQGNAVTRRFAYCTDLDCPWFGSWEE